MINDNDLDSLVPGNLNLDSLLPKETPLPQYKENPADFISMKNLPPGGPDALPINYDINNPGGFPTTGQVAKASFEMALNSPSNLTTGAYHWARHALTSVFVGAQAAKEYSDQLKKQQDDREAMVEAMPQSGQTWLSTTGASLAGSLVDPATLAIVAGTEGAGSALMKSAAELALPARVAKAATVGAVAGGVAGVASIPIGNIEEQPVSGEDVANNMASWALLGGGATALFDPVAKLFAKKPIEAEEGEPSVQEGQAAEQSQPQAETQGEQVKPEPSTAETVPQLDEDQGQPPQVEARPSAKAMEAGVNFTGMQGEDGKQINGDPLTIAAVNDKRKAFQLLPDDEKKIMADQVDQSQLEAANKEGEVEQHLNDIKEKFNKGNGKIDDDPEFPLATAAMRPEEIAKHINELDLLNENLSSEKHRAIVQEIKNGLKKHMAPIGDQKTILEETTNDAENKSEKWHAAVQRTNTAEGEKASLENYGKKLSPKNEKAVANRLQNVNDYLQIDPQNRTGISAKLKIPLNQLYNLSHELEETKTNAEMKKSNWEVLNQPLNDPNTGAHVAHTMPKKDNFAEPQFSKNRGQLVDNDRPFDVFSNEFNSEVDKKLNQLDLTNEDIARINDVKDEESEDAGQKSTLDKLKQCLMK